MSILLYGRTERMLTKRMVKNLDSNYTRMLQAILNKSWRQHPTKQQLYGHLQLITKTIQVKRTRYAGYCWRSRDELISDLLQSTPSHGRAKAGRPFICRCLPPDTRSKARRPIKVGIKGRGGRERAETRTLLVCAAHRLT